jgi:lipopolysaccharide biosynthesis glycosyltransferase
MADSKPKVTIVFATDEAYFGLAKDLASSLLETVRPNNDIDPVCLDIGLSNESRAWLAQNGVKIQTASMDRLPDALRPFVAARPYMMAQYYRPYFPELAPDADLIIHIDCDAWVQNSQFLDACVNAIQARPGSIALAPSNNHYNYSYYSDLQETIDMQHNWVFGCYEKHVADALAKMAFFSSGVFAASPTSPVWKRWEEEIVRIVPLVATINPSVLHLAEQTALNGVVRMDLSVTVLDPLYNFHCNAGGVARDERTGKVVANLVHPNRELGIVHLADWRQRRTEYVNARLTFRPDSPPVTL